MHHSVTVKRNKFEDKSQLSDEFIAPDGGWGWLICIAAGCSNLCSFAVLQQFGLLFRDRFELMGMPCTDITTIINLHSCVTSCTGLLNGPMFRLLTFRKVAFLGAILISVGIFLTSLSYSFTTYVITFSLLYGAGTGINASANALALNTYFKEKRRVATGFSWTLTALGPIIFPQIIAIMLPYYGVQGSVMLFSGLALNTIAFALFYQPVQWHINKSFEIDTSTETPEIKCRYCRMMYLRKNNKLFSSQYLYNTDRNGVASYEIIDPGTPMMSLSNDGWYSAKNSNYGSRLSLSANIVSNFDRKSDIQQQNFTNLNMSQNQVMLSGTNRLSYINLANLANENMSNYCGQGTIASNQSSYTNLSNLTTKKDIREKRKEINKRIKIDESHTEECENVDECEGFLNNKSNLVTNNRTIQIGGVKRILNDKSIDKQVNEVNEPDILINHVEKDILPTNNEILDIKRNSFNVLLEASKELECCCDEDRQLYYKNKMKSVDEIERIEETGNNLTLLQKILIFFDLDLLKDISYVNLMVGVTIAGFAELNYSILTPFVLADYEFTKQQTAMVMSLLGAMDISVRFLVPFVAEKIGWENNTYFLIGIFGMALGRISIAHFRSYSSVLIASCWIGLNKGLRTVFMALVIPTYVPLDRLPGASGLQLLFAGIFYFLVGPVIGWIRDNTNFTVTLHCLNVLTFLTCISWTAEKYYRLYKK